MNMTIARVIQMARFPILERYEVVEPVRAAKTYPVTYGSNWYERNTYPTKLDDPFYGSCGKCGEEHDDLGRCPVCGWCVDEMEGVSGKKSYTGSLWDEAEYQRLRGAITGGTDGNVMIA